MFLCISLFFILCSAFLPFFIAKKNPLLCDKLFAFFYSIGALLGLGFIAFGIIKGLHVAYTLPFSILFSCFSIKIEMINLLFMIPIYLIGSMSAIYSTSYWSTAQKGLSSSFRYRLYLCLFTISMILLVIADNFIMFITFWEIMSLLAYGLITIDEDSEEAQSAGYLYFIATHTGVIALMGMFAIIQVYFDFSDFSSALGKIDANLAIASSIFLLGVFGFGMKAGFFPLYFWLPSAHSSAPVPISALLSGVMIKMGIYGILKILFMFSNIPHWWGWLIFTIGILSGILGVVYAIAQHDIKKLLAYHSIENIGIIAIGIGLAMLGRSYHNSTLVLFGLAGALFHVINHSLFKPLLFYSAGSIIEKYHTRDIGHYGGIIKVQPYTALFFLIGAVSISGLPPFNGFASEWLLYMGMFKTLFSHQNTLMPVVFGILSLALIGGLALACFVKVFGISFLGNPRKIELSNVKESSLFMLFPMAFLSTICFVLGVFPSIMKDILLDIASAFNQKNIYVKIDTLINLSEAYLWFFMIFGVVLAVVLYQTRGKISKNIGTWACGFSHKTPRAQYTSSSLMQMILDLFGWTLHVKRGAFCSKELFSQKYHFYLHQNDKTIYWLAKISEKFLLFCSKLRTIIHNGYMGIYVLYIFVALILMLLYVGN